LNLVSYVDQIVFNSFWVAVDKTRLMTTSQSANKKTNFFTL